jgi:hypothetical protein
MGELIEVFGSVNASDSVVVHAPEDLAKGARVVSRGLQS